MTEERRLTALDVLRITEYRHFILARFFYIMALRMVTTIVGWRIYEITHNPLAIGLIGLSEFIPAFCLAPRFSICSVWPVCWPYRLAHLRKSCKTIGSNGSLIASYSAPG
jgi:hypothetical protein